MNLPVPAREHLGIDGPVTLLVFGQRGRIILTPAGVADELLEFAAEHTARRKNTAQLNDTSRAIVDQDA